MFDKEDSHYLTSENFKLFFSFVFDISFKSHVAQYLYLKVLTKLELSEDDLVPRDLLIDFVVERGAVEMRIAADEIKQLTANNALYKRSASK